MHGCYFGLVGEALNEAAKYLLVTLCMHVGLRGDSPDEALNKAAE